MTTTNYESTRTGGRNTTVLSAAHLTYPLTQKEARHSARLWFTGTPHLTLAEWRDNRCRVHCMGLPIDPARIEAFNAAFASELAAIIAGGLNHG